jgi:Mn2+/Fe2+ NRAMP family transporter
MIPFRNSQDEHTTSANNVTQSKSLTPLIILVTLLCGDRSVMGARVNPLILTILGWLTAAVMLAATVMMFVTWRL